MWPSGLLAAEKQQVARALMEVHFSKNEVPRSDDVWKVDESGIACDIDVVV